MAQQLLGVTTAELVTLAGGRHLPVHLEETVLEGVWELETENTELTDTKSWKSLIRARRTIDRRITTDGTVKVELEDLFYDALEQPVGNSCKVL